MPRPKNDIGPPPWAGRQLSREELYVLIARGQEKFNLGDAIDLYATLPMLAEALDRAAVTPFSLMEVQDAKAWAQGYLPHLDREYLPEGAACLRVLLSEIARLETRVANLEKEYG